MNIAAITAENNRVTYNVRESTMQPRAAAPCWWAEGNMLLPQLSKQGNPLILTAEVAPFTPDGHIKEHLQNARHTVCFETKRH